MKILYVCQRVPFPPDRGDKIASHHAIRHLARRHSVSVAALADSPEEIGNAAALRDLGIEVEAVEHPASAARWNAIRAAAGAVPFSVAWFSSPELARRIGALCRRERPDVVVPFSSSMAQYASLADGVPVVADFVDLDSRKWALYAAAHRPPRSWLYREEARRLLAFEQVVARQAAAVLLRTPAELEDASRLIPEGRFEVVSNGVDLEYFRPPAERPSTPGIVFTGVMDYFPNVEGVLWFADRVFPAVRREVPEATFTIVGARPSRAVQRLGERPGITVTGRVADVREHLGRALVAVAPLATARGVQNKVLEALATATPAVISPSVAQGIDARPGEGIVVADEHGRVAAEIVSLLREPERARALGRAGRSLVERRYVWAEHLERLESILLEAASGGHPARRVAP